MVARVTEDLQGCGFEVTGREDRQVARRDGMEVEYGGALDGSGSRFQVEVSWPGVVERTLELDWGAAGERAAANGKSPGPNPL